MRITCPALTAAVLLAASPLLISHMWQQCSACGTFCLARAVLPCRTTIAYHDNRLAHGWRVMGLASVLYVASLTYQYQWIIVPCLFSLIIVDSSAKMDVDSFNRNRC